MIFYQVTEADDRLLSFLIVFSHCRRSVGESVLFGQSSISVSSREQSACLLVCRDRDLASMLNRMTPKMVRVMARLMMSGDVPVD